MKKWISLLLVTTVILSCKTRKNAMQNASDNDSIKIENSGNQDKTDDGKNISDRLTFYENIYIHPEFNQIKINSKITADNLRVSPLDATIYIESDKKIWSNINFLFFNAARAIITPEGIKAVDKYNKNYIDSDFEYLNNLLNINFIDYKTLEKILLGRTFLLVSNRNSEIKKNEDGYQLSSITNQKIITNGVEREYKVNMRYSNDYDLIYVKLQDVKSDDAVEIVYDQWESFDNNLRLPQNVKIIIKGSKTSQIVLENTKFGFTKMETPYSVPANYKKIEIK
jgi:hypothetical protein